MPVNETDLRDPHREVPIGPGLATVKENPPGAVHGLDNIVSLIYLREVHVLAVVIPVTGAAPQLTMQHDGCLNLVVAPPTVFFTPELYQLVPDNHALWVHEGEARALGMQAEEIQLLSQAAMIAALGLLKHVQVCLKISRLFKGRAIDALQHGIAFTAAPVGPRYAQELNPVGLYPVSADNVGSGTKVNKVSLLIEADLLTFRKIPHKLNLIILPLSLQGLEGLVPL